MVFKFWTCCRVDFNDSVWFCYTNDGYVLYHLKKPDLFLSAIYLYLINYISQYSVIAMSGFIVDEKWIVPVFLLLVMKILMKKEEGDYRNENNLSCVK